MLLASIAKQGASAAAAKVRNAGVGRLPRVLSASAIEALRVHVLSELDAAERKASTAEHGTGHDDATALDEAFRLVVVGSGTQRLSDERGRSSLSNALRAALNPELTGDASATTKDGDGSDLRWDLRLSPSAPAVRDAMRELLAPGATLGGAIEQLAGGSDAQLWELAAIVSAPGAAPQVVHADTVWAKTPLLFTAFIALQDISRDMGPTRFLSRTHGDARPHKELRRCGDATGLVGASGEPPPSQVGCLQAGDAALYDGRLLHCGGANRSDRLRCLFYVTFRHKDAVGRDVSGDGGAAAASEASSLSIASLRADLFQSGKGAGKSV